MCVCEFVCVCIVVCVDVCGKVSQYNIYSMNPVLNAEEIGMCARWLKGGGGRSVRV